MLDQLRRHWFLLAVACVVLVSFQWADLFEVYVRSIPVGWVVTFVMFLNGLTLPTPQFLGALKRPAQVIIGVVCGYVIVALLGYPASRCLELFNTDFAVGLLVISAMPTTVSSGVIWTRLAGGNDALTLLTTVASSGISFIAVPSTLFFTVGSFISLKPVEMLGRLVLVVLLPVGVAQGVRQIKRVSRLALQHKTLLSVIPQILILNMVFVGAVGGVLQMGRRSEQLAFKEFLILAVVTAGLHGLAAAACWMAGKGLRWNRADRLSLLFSGSQKTLPASLYICSRFFPSFPFATIPCVMYHVFQLIIDSWLAEMARQGEGTKL